MVNPSHRRRHSILGASLVANHFFPSTFQFERTRAIRAEVYRRARLAARARILEVGTGEGRIAAEMADRTGRSVVGLDLIRPPAPRAGVRFVQGSAEVLPFPAASFDAVGYHFAMLWVEHPLLALEEARRVLAPGGVVLILSEPDLESRRDEPDTGLGRAIARSVRASGGHPEAGREVARWLRETGFRPAIETTRREWIALSRPEEAEHELAFLLERGVLGAEEFEAMAAAERDAAKSGRRRVLLPISYGVGFIPWDGKG